MIHESKICKYCLKEFKNIEGKVFSNHVRWCNKNPNPKFSKDGYEKLIKSKVVKIKIIKQCEVCGKNFEIIKNENSTKKEKKCCSRKCSNSIGHKYVIGLKKQICQKCGIEFDVPKTSSQKICDKCNNYVKVGKSKKKKNYYCDICGKQIGKTKTKLCFDCLVAQKRTGRSEKVIYKNKTNFKFALSDYTEEFDFSLIEQYGWYKAKNHGNNLNGVSRDHIVSVSYGYKNNIDPKIISHPANCQLLIHNDNSSKGNKNSQKDVEKLKQKILLWNQKYKDYNKYQKFLIHI